MEWAFWYFPLGRLSPRLPAPTGIRGTEAKCWGRHSEGLCLQTEVQEPRLLLPSGKPVHFRQVITKIYCQWPDEPIRFQTGGSKCWAPPPASPRSSTRRRTTLARTELEKLCRKSTLRTNPLSLSGCSGSTCLVPPKTQLKCCVVPHTTLEIR